MSEATTATTQILRLWDTRAERRRRRQAIWTYVIGALLICAALVYLGFRLGDEHQRRVEAEAAIRALPSIFIPIEAVVR